MKNIKLKERDVLKSLSLSLTETIQAEELWRTLSCPKTQKSFQTQFDIYPAFFNAVRASAFSSLLLGLARLSDGNIKSACLDSLLDICLNKSTSSDEREYLVNLKQEFGNHSETWKGIRLLRSNIFAHTSLTLSESDAFKRASITANQLSEALKTCYNIYIHLTSFFDISNDELSLIRYTTKNETQKLLRNLKEGRDARFTIQNKPASI